MKKLICVLFAAVIGFNSFGAAVFSANAETVLPDWVFTNLPRSTSSPITGSYSYKSATFRSATTYSVRSPQFKSCSDTTDVYTVSFDYAINVTGSGHNWTITVQLWNEATNTKVADLKSVSGTANASGNLYYYNVGIDAKYGVNTTQYHTLRIVATNTNSSTNSAHFVKLDNIGFDCGGVLGTSYDYPDYTLSFNNGVFKTADSSVYGDILIHKGVQTGTWFPSLHEVVLNCFKTDRTTGEVVETTHQEYSILHDAAASTTNTNTHMLQDLQYNYVYSLTYTNDGGGLSGISQPALPSIIPLVVGLSSSNYTTSSSACGWSGSWVPKYVVISGFSATFYNDIHMTSLMNGASKWYKSNVGASSVFAAAKINSSGALIDNVSCP